MPRSYGTLTSMLTSIVQVPTCEQRRLTIRPPDLQPEDLSRENLDPDVESKPKALPLVVLVEGPNIVDTGCPEAPTFQAIMLSSLDCIRLVLLEVLKDYAAVYIPRQELTAMVSLCTY